MEKINEIYLGESKNNKDKKVKSETITSLVCYNDIYRYLFQKKISKIEDELNKINKNKILKNIPKIGKYLKKVYQIYDLLLNKEKAFNYNFITFEIGKIYKFSININSCLNKKDLSSFFEKLIAKLINEHKLLYELNKDFFYKKNSNYKYYNLIKTKIEKMINSKKYNYLLVGEYLESIFNNTDKEKEENIYGLVISGLFENIKNINQKNTKEDFNESDIIDLTKIKDNSKMKNSTNNNNEIKIDELNINPPNKNINSSKILQNENVENINDSKKTIFFSSF